MSADSEQCFTKVVGVEGRTLYCSPSGADFSGSESWPWKSLGMGTPCGHASTATLRLRASAAQSGTSCRHVKSADRQLAPPAGQHLAPASIACTHRQAGAQLLLNTAVLAQQQPVRTAFEQRSLCSCAVWTSRLEADQLHSVGSPRQHQVSHVRAHAGLGHSCCNVGQRKDSLVPDRSSGLRVYRLCWRLTYTTTLKLC